MQTYVGIQAREARNRPENPIPTDSFIRLCDNRLRAIRFWLEIKDAESGTHARYLLYDVQLAVQNQKAKLRNDTEWIVELEEVLKRIDFGDIWTFQNVYDHLGRPYPKAVVGKATFDWRRWN